MDRSGCVPLLATQNNVTAAQSEKLRADTALKNDSSFFRHLAVIFTGF